MLRATLRFSVVTTLLLAATAGLFLYQKHDATAEKLRAAEKRNEFLKNVVARLTSERRVADVIVTDQSIDAATGKQKTTLLFVEYARDGSTTLPPKSFTIDGNVAHLDALVVKFAGRFVEDNDPLKGHSVALFTRLYGESQAPENAFPIDAPNGIPDVYRSPDASVNAEQSSFERELWNNFWRLADDAGYRTSMGVRVAQGEGVWSPFLPERLYTVSIESDGGLNLVSEPLKGIYREALKHGASSATASPRD
jgi:hypothetical protein